MLVFRMAAQYRQERRRFHRQVNRRILFGDQTDSSDSEASGMDSQADDLAPYSTDYLVEFCRKNWNVWTVQSQRVLNDVSQELLIRPTLAHSDRINTLEVMVHRLIEVN